MENNKFYIATPIYYPSGNFHVGTCYCTIVADVIARYNRLAGKDVFFLTGTDEHGQKIENKAKEAGITPKEYVDKIVENSKQLWDILNISYDRFIRTTDKDHEECVQKILEKLYASGDIYKSEYEGKYCTPCESFFTESQLIDGKCPDCSREVTVVKEESYFFRLSKYEERLKKFFSENPEFLMPETRKNEMFASFFDKGLEDLCITRTTFDWGIKVPFDKKHIVYVWVDALSNYISALGYLSEDDSLFRKFWPADLHLVGKEITRFHSIIWPALLMALDLPLPKRVFGHGWLTVGGRKISKSFGNYKDPREYLKYSSVDSLRYYLLREIKLGLDGNFDEEEYIKKINSDLANDYGNLVSRTLAMSEKYFGGVLSRKDYEDLANEQADNELINVIDTNRNEYIKYMEMSRPDVALDRLMQIVSFANKYIDINEPWVLAKDETKRQRLGKVIYMLAETIRIVTIMMKPYMISSTEKVLSQLGTDEKDFKSIFQFGGIKDGTVCKKGEIIFPRIDASEALAKKDVENVEEVQGVKYISIDDVDKVELKVGQITKAEKVEGSSKLYKLEVNLGSESRQVVSGIAKYYSAQELINKKVIVVTNLKPVTLCKVESNGMLLAAGDKDVVRLITVDGDVENGENVH